MCWWLLYHYAISIYSFKQRLLDINYIYTTYQVAFFHTQFNTCLRLFIYNYIFVRLWANHLFKRGATEISILYTCAAYKILYDDSFGRIFLQNICVVCVRMLSFQPQDKMELRFFFFLSDKYIFCPKQLLKIYKVLYFILLMNQAFKEWFCHLRVCTIYCILYQMVF